MNKNLLFGLVAGLAVSSSCFAVESRTTGRYGNDAGELIRFLSDMGIRSEGALGSLCFKTTRLKCEIQKGDSRNTYCLSDDFNVSGASAEVFSGLLDRMGVKADHALDGHSGYQVEELICKVHGDESGDARYGCSVTFTYSN